MDESPAGVRIDIVSDVICPWCYIGKRQLERALATLEREGLRFSVHWNPFQLNPDMPKEGRDRIAYRVQKFGSAERARELDERVAGAAANAGLSFRQDLMLRTPNTLDAHRLIWLAGREGMQDAVVEALFVAYFTQGRDVGDHAVLADCAAEVGMDRAAVADFPRRRHRREGNAGSRSGGTRSERQRGAVVLPRWIQPLFRRHAGGNHGRGAPEGKSDPPSTRRLTSRLPPGLGPPWL
jgi:predicted DsbA family dithiol-disulfide isomerase